MFDPINEYYNNYDEENRLTSKHGQIEFLTTMRYIRKYLLPGMHVLEIGAGTGRYSHTLAKNGYYVDAAELVPHNIEIFKSKITQDEKITIRQSDATDLSGFNNDTYDITLMLGPMYHLFNEKDKLKALSEALRVTKKGGIIFVSYCIADASIIGYGFRDGYIFKLIEKGMLDTQDFKAISKPVDVFEIIRKEDIDYMMSHFSVKKLHYVATDLFTNYIQETVDAMDDQTFDIYLKYHFHICERNDMVGITHHSLDIFQKE